MFLVHCQECNQDCLAHEFYGLDGSTQRAKLLATNASQSWRKEMCYACWLAFQNRAFVTIQRTGNVFTATCAF